MRLDLITITCFLALTAGTAGESPKNFDWPRVGNDAGCMRYSPLDQINRQNVTRPEPIWTYHTRELDSRKGKTIECTPIVIDGVMYITTAYLRIVALDAATGKELWQFDPLEDHPFEFQPTSGGVNRGCASWSDGKPDGERNYSWRVRRSAVPLDAKTGKLDRKSARGASETLARN